MLASGRAWMKSLMTAAPGLALPLCHGVSTHMMSKPSRRTVGIQQLRPDESEAESVKQDGGRVSIE